jgi:hypothetical protein
VAQEATRRGALAAAALVLPLLASACKGLSALGTPPRPLPDVAVARQAIASERELIARYTAVLAAMPALAAPLHPLLAEHAAHLSRLRGRLSVPGAPAGHPPRPGRPATSSPAVVPPSRAAALAWLRAAEDDASASLLRHLPVVSPSFAQLLASIAASEATHALLLSGRAAARPTRALQPTPSGRAAARPTRALRQAEPRRGNLP